MSGRISEGKAVTDLDIDDDTKLPSISYEYNGPYISSTFPLRLKTYKEKPRQRLSPPRELPAQGFPPEAQTHHQKTRQSRASGYLSLISAEQLLSIWLFLLDVDRHRIKKNTGER